MYQITIITTGGLVTYEQSTNALCSKDNDASIASPRNDTAESRRKARGKTAGEGGNDGREGESSIGESNRTRGNRALSASERSNHKSTTTGGRLSVSERDNPN